MEIIYDSPSGSARPLREAYPSAAEGRVVLQIAISKAVAPLIETSPRIPEFGTPNRGLLDRFRGLLDRRHQEAELTVAVICQEMGMSRPTLNRRLKTLTGLAIKEHLQLLRLAKAAERLMSSSDPISIIAYDCGFTDPNYFCRAFAKKFNQPPTHFRSKHAG